MSMAQDPEESEARGTSRPEVEARSPREDLSDEPTIVIARPGPPSPSEAARAAQLPAQTAFDDERTLELREEELIAHKELRELGEVTLRTAIDDVPGRLEVDAYREEVLIEHEPVGQVVSEREAPREEDGVLVVPVYEEQLVVSKRLVLKERLRIRRIRTTERQLFEDTLRRERLVIEDPQNTGLVHEQHPTEAPAGESSPTSAAEATQPEGGLLEHLVRRVME